MKEGTVQRRAKFMIKRVRIGIAAVFLVAGSIFGVFGLSAAGAAPLPDNCTRDQGEVTCTTFEGPGNNQAGVGTTTETETQGNTTNKNPEPQDLQDSSSCNPPKSNGRPCNP
jgi:hypothetical protein